MTRPPDQTHRGSQRPRIIGGFEVISVLGEGGMGVVYLARQPVVQRLVALKVMMPDLARDAEFVARFVREAQAAGALAHPNLVGVVAAGVDTPTRSPFMALEYVEGIDLKKLLERTPILEERRALLIGRDVARALEHAHQRGFVHRDVKPANVLIANDGTVKLADLGLAKRTEDRGVTQTGEILGTPHYMSPEQANGDQVDIRSDLFALGLMLYRMTTGQIPFDAPSAMAVLTRRITGECPDPREIAPHLSPGFARVVRRLTAREVEDRCPSPLAAIGEIEGALEGPRAPKRGGRSVGRPTGPSSGAVIAAVATVAALVVVVGVIALAGSGNGPAVGPTTAAGGSGPQAIPTPSDGPAIDVDEPPSRKAREPRVDGARLVEALGKPAWRMGGIGKDIAFSDDGSRVLVVSDAETVVWERETGEELFYRWTPTARGAMTGDGRWVIVGFGMTIRAWEIDGDREVDIPTPPREGSIGATTASADGTVIVSGHESGSVFVWSTDLANEAVEPPTRLEEPTRFRCRDLALTRDARTLVAAWEGRREVRVFDLAEAAAPVRIESAGAFDQLVAVSPEARRVIVASTRAEGRKRVFTSARLFDLHGASSSWQDLREPPGSRGVAFDPTGALALVGGFDGALCLWSVEGEPRLVWKRPDAHRSWIDEVAFSADGQLAASAGDDRTVRFWDLARRPPSEAITTGPAHEGHQGEVFSIRSTAGGELVSGGALRVGRWEGSALAVAADGMHATTLTIDEAGDSAVAVDRHGSLARIRLGGPDAGRIDTIARGVTARAIAISPSGETTLWAGGGRIGRSSAGGVTVDDSPRAFSDLAFLDDSKAFGLDAASGEVFTVDLDEGISSFDGITAVTAIATAPSAKELLVVGRDGTAYIGRPFAGEIEPGFVVTVVPGERVMATLSSEWVAVASGSVVDVRRRASPYRPAASIDLTALGYLVTALEIGVDERTLYVGTSRGKIFVFELTAD